MNQRSGIGKCVEGHIGSFGYPTRPGKRYPFCPECGKAMVWECPNCGEPIAVDREELARTRFCRACGAPCFEPGMGPRPAGR